MEDFTVWMLYSSAMYLFTFFMYLGEKKRDIWDILLLIFAPIGVPIVIVYCFFKIMLE